MLGAGHQNLLIASTLIREDRISRDNAAELHEELASQYTMGDPLVIKFWKMMKEIVRRELLLPTLVEAGGKIDRKVFSHVVVDLEYVSVC